MQKDKPPSHSDYAAIASNLEAVLHEGIEDVNARNFNPSTCRLHRNPSQNWAGMSPSFHGTYYDQTVKTAEHMVSLFEKLTIDNPKCVWNVKTAQANLERIGEGKASLYAELEVGGLEGWGIFL